MVEEGCCGYFFGSFIPDPCLCLIISNKDYCCMDGAAGMWYWWLL